MLLSCNGSYLGTGRHDKKGESKDFDNRTCMSKLQQWGKGGKREVNCSRNVVMTTSIMKPMHDPGQVKSRKIDPDSIVN